MGELGHVNTAIRVRELGVDCFIDEHRELGIKVAELYSPPRYFLLLSGEKLLTCLNLYFWKENLLFFSDVSLNWIIKAV